jgi:hypothetical protein
VTDTDKSNIDKIIKFATKMGYTDESMDIFIDRLRNPRIDESYGKYLDSDLRKRWDYDPSLTNEDNDEIEDPGYKEFKKFFHIITCETCLNSFSRDGRFTIININEFNENIKLYNKNKIKIKTYLMEFFLNTYAMASNFRFMLQDSLNYLLRTLPEIYEKLRKGEPLSEEELTKFIIKAFEKIGTFKNTKKSNNLQLVLSCNFADWLLSSTSENWTSCFDLSCGYFWYAVPGLIGDMNRAFLYSTKGINKEFEGIKVEKVINRTWLLLDKKDNKNIVKFYPNRSAFSDSIVKKITGDDSYRNEYSIRGGIEGKHPITPIFFEQGIYPTTSQDACKMYEKNKELLIKIGESGGSQWFSKDLKELHEGREISVTRKYLPFSSKEKASSMFFIRICNICGKIENLIEHDGKCFCKECFDKKYQVCGTCGNIHLTEENRILIINNKVFCVNCVDRYFIKCDSCGRYYDKNEIKEIDNKKYCKNCHKEKYHKCQNCKNVIEIEKLIIIHDKIKDLRLRRCPVCTKKLYKNHIACKTCNDLWEPERLLKDGTCPKCNNLEY